MNPNEKSLFLAAMKVVKAAKVCDAGNDQSEDVFAELHWGDLNNLQKALAEFDRLAIEQCIEQVKGEEPTRTLCQDCFSGKNSDHNWTPNCAVLRRTEEKESEGK